MNKTKNSRTFIIHPPTHTRTHTLLHIHFLIPTLHSTKQMKHNYETHLHVNLAPGIYRHALKDIKK